MSRDILTRDGKPRKRAPGAGRKAQTGSGAAPSDLLSESVTIRMQPDLRKRIGAGAERNGRSVSQEIATRLQSSFDLPKKLTDEFGPPHVYALAKIIAMLVTQIEQQTGLRWDRDTYTNQIANRLVSRLFLRTCPNDDPLIPPAVLAEAERQIDSIGDLSPELAKILAAKMYDLSFVDHRVMTEIMTGGKSSGKHQIADAFDGAFLTVDQVRKVLGFQAAFWPRNALTENVSIEDPKGIRKPK